MTVDTIAAGTSQAYTAQVHQTYTVSINGGQYASISNLTISGVAATEPSLGPQPERRTIGPLSPGDTLTVHAEIGSILVEYDSFGSGSGTVTSVNVVPPAAGMTVSGGPVTTAGSLTLALADDLAAVEALAATGLVRRTGANTWSAGTAVNLATEVTGVLPVANYTTGTPTGTKFVRDDGVLAVPASGSGDALTTNPLSQFAATTSLQLKGVISDETGSGALVFGTSPTLVTPALGTPASGTLTNCTGLPLTTGVTGVLPVANYATGTPTGSKFVRDDGVLAIPAGGGSGDALTTNPLSQFAATTSLQLLGVMSDETGTGALVFGTSPVLTTPNIGTPSAGTLTSCTGLPIATGVSGLAAGVATFLATPTSANLAAAVTNETGTGSLVFATSPTLVTPALGTPASGNLSNCTNIPGGQITGLATGMVSFLATPTSANLIATVTDETGTGSLVFGTSPTIATPTVNGGTVNQATVKHAKPTANSTVVGEVVSGYNAGATITLFQPVYMGSAGTWLLADADGTGTRRPRGLAAAAGTSGNPMDVLDNGVARLDSWTWTPGGDVYLSATAGALTQTAPASAAEVVRIGYALSATEIRVRTDSFSVTV